MKSFLIIFKIDSNKKMVKLFLIKKKYANNKFKKKKQHQKIFSLDSCISKKVFKNNREQIEDSQYKLAAVDAVIDHIQKIEELKKKLEFYENTETYNFALNEINSKNQEKINILNNRILELENQIEQSNEENEKKMSLFENNCKKIVHDRFFLMKY